MENQAVSGTKKPLFGGRKPLFTQKELLLLTGPLLVEQLLEVTVGMADTMMVSRCGEAAISGVSLVDMINNLIIVLFSALATGGAVVVSQFLGAREQKSANKSAGQLILLSGILGLGVGVLCFVLARPMIRLFYGSIDADVLDAGTLYLKIIAVSYPFLALYNAGAALFRSMGNSRISMQISVLMNIINIVGNAVCIFGFKMGVDGVAWPSVVSRCGEAAISGVSLVDMINNLIIVLFAALATGGAVVVSQFLGAREQKEADASSGQLLLLSGVFGLLVGAFCFVFARPMIRLFYGAIDADVLDASVLYLRIIAISYPFLALYNGGAALFRSMGNSKISMQISFLMNVINIVGNAVCIFGFKMGVDGVAWPSVLSRVVAAALILRKCYQKGNAITVPKTTRLDAKMTKRILGIGIPSAFENSLFEAGRILVVSMISTFGTVQIAANAVANNLDGMGVIPGKALSLAMITVVGRCIGARDDEQAVYYTRKLTVWSYIAMSLSNGAILLFLHKLIGIYALSGETMALSELLVRIHAGFAILLWTLSFVLPNALRAANDVKFTMIVSILSMAVWRLGFSYLLCVRMGWGAVGVWIAMIIDWVCRVTCFVLRFRSGVWKTKYQA